MHKRCRNTHQTKRRVFYGIFHAQHHTLPEKLGSTEIWTRIAGFKVQSANHYTIEPSLALIFDLWEKILFPAGFEPATLCVWSTRDNHYTMETYIKVVDYQKKSFIYLQLCRNNGETEVRNLLCDHPILTVVHVIIVVFALQKDVYSFISQYTLLSTLWTLFSSSWNL